VKRVGPFYRHHDVDENELSVVRRRVYDQILKIAGAFSPEIIFSFYATNPALFGCYIGNALRVPHVVCLRGNDIGRNIFSTVWLPVLNIILQNAARVACVNDHLLTRLLTAFPALADKTCVIRNSVVLPLLKNVGSRAYIEKHTSWAEDAVIAVFIGTPREKKGIGILLQAISAAAEKSNVRLLIAGPELKNSERQLCGALWDSLKNRNILHCTGQREREEALTIAAEGDLIVMPSIEDGLANGLLEGMALGLSPIASDIFSDVITPGRSGVVIPANDVPALTEALVSLAKNPELRRRLADAAKAVIAESFHPARERAEYIGLISQIVAGEQRGEPANKHA
jgi:glycosyltransferase involved in cell wall biosynthesis